MLTFIRYIPEENQECRRSLANYLHGLGFHVKLCCGGVSVYAINYEHPFFKFLPKPIVTLWLWIVFGWITLN